VPAANDAPPPGAHAYELPVRYGDTDQMGVAYYANYLYWFEIARTEWLRAHGKSYRELEAEGVILPVTEAYCRYLASARYDDRLKLWSWVASTRLAPPSSESAAWAGPPRTPTAQARVRSAT